MGREPRGGGHCRLPGHPQRGQHRRAAGAHTRAGGLAISTRIDDPRVQIAVETPNFPDAPGHADLQAIGSGVGRPEPEELASRGWLSQLQHDRGTRISTVGLRLYAAHPELEMNNVPTILVEPAIALLKELAGYALAGGHMEEGDVMQMRDSLPCLVGFVDTSREVGVDDAMVRVVFLS